MAYYVFEKKNNIENIVVISAKEGKVVNENHSLSLCSVQNSCWNVHTGKLDGTEEKRANK